MGVLGPVVWLESGVRVVKVTRRQKEEGLVAQVNARAWACPCHPLQVASSHPASER